MVGHALRKFRRALSGRMVFPGTLGLLLSAQSVLALPADAVGLGVAIEKQEAEIGYLDVCLSNLPDEAEVKQQITDPYREAIQRAYHARLGLVRNDYGAALGQLNQSRAALARAYDMMLAHYLATGAAVLDEASLELALPTDQHVRYFLSEGYREARSAQLAYIRGRHISPHLYGDMIQAYQFGIENMRRARRFGVLALIEARLSREEKERYRVITLDDYLNPSEFEPERADSDFDRVGYLLLTLISREVLPAAVSTRHLPDPVVLPLMEIHYDNYRRRIGARDSVRERLVMELDRRLFYTEQMLPNRNAANRFEVPAAESDARPPRVAEPASDELPPTDG